MQRSVLVFIAGMAVGGLFGVPIMASDRSMTTAASQTSVVQLRLYTIDKGRLDDFAKAWHAGVYSLRTSQGYRIPFAAKIPSTNQFVWVLAYDGPETWEAKEAAYYKSTARKAMSPDPAQWIARPEQLLVNPIVDLAR